MLKHARISRRFLLPLALAISLLFAFVPAAWVATHAQSPSLHLMDAEKYYLALGDLLAYGYQPDNDFTHGYVDDLFPILQQEGVKKVANMGCPGELSVTFIRGGCSFTSTIPPHYKYKGPQLTAALNFLKANPGKVSIVTLDIGSNDVLPDLLGCTVGSNFDADLATLDRNLTGTILLALQKALTFKGQITGRIVMMNYYNPFPNCLTTPNAQQFTQAFNEFNTHLAADVSGFGTIVDVFDAFDGITTPNICTYTWMCTPPPLVPDIHPTDQGYSVIAKTFAAAIPPD